MFLSYNWLRELTGTTSSPAQVRERLTNVGLAVDAVQDRNGDFVLDVEVPSNRGDCLSHLGIARELAAVEGLTVNYPASEVQNVSGRTSDVAAVEIRDAHLCPRYAARAVRDVQIGPSPGWLIGKLETIGQRPINNVADITNYVLHETGQPLHAFDLSKLNGGRIVVRRAAQGESIKTLDGVDRKLDDDMLVIADARRPVAVAGVMGGEDSEISATTTSVLIESAYFDPASVRRTAKRLGLHTEASHRFERGADPLGVIAAQQRCVALICELAHGVAAEEVVDVYPHPAKPVLVRLRPERVEAITSLQVPAEQIKRILSALGFILTAEDGDLTYQVPSWRHDVSIEDDLVEEIARHAGFDNIRIALPPASGAGEYHSTEWRKRNVRTALAQAGYNEAINLSFIETTDEFELIPHFDGGAAEVTLINPIIEEASRMRPTLLPGLLSSVRHNLNQAIRDVCLFELGRVFAGEQGNLPREREALALVATGGAVEANRANPARDLDFYDLKGALESAVDALNLPRLSFASAQVKHLRPGQSAAISLNGERVGSIGRLSDAVAGLNKFKQPVLVAELDFSALLTQPDLPVLYSPLPRYPSVSRDISLLVDRQTTLAELLAAAQKESVPNLSAISFVGTYEGEGIPDSKRSVTLRFEYRAEDHTMRDEEVDALHWPLIETLKQQFNAQIR